MLYDFMDDNPFSWISDNSEFSNGPVNFCIFNFSFCMIDLYIDSKQKPLYWPTYKWVIVHEVIQHFGSYSKATNDVIFVGVLLPGSHFIS
jgi:hypothetical protein